MSPSQRPTTERAPTTFVVGYHQIHPDVSLNYQMNRFSTGMPDCCQAFQPPSSEITLV